MIEQRFQSIMDIMAYLLAMFLSLVFGIAYMLSTSTKANQNFTGISIMMFLMGAFSLIELIISAVQTFYNGDNSKIRYGIMLISLFFVIPFLNQITYYLHNNKNAILLILAILFMGLIIYILINRRARK